MQKYLLLFSLLLLTACSDTSQKFDPEKQYTLEALYERGLKKLKSSNFLSAAEAFETIETQHPLSSWANKAQILAAYSLFRASKYEEAIELLKDFLSLHFTHELAPYAQYLLSMCYFSEVRGIERDQQKTREALSAFNNLLEKYGSSEYAQDARAKKEACLEFIAGQDMLIGRYYLEQHLEVAALRRFQSVVDVFSMTSYVPEALYRLVEGCLYLGLTDEAIKHAAVLGHNYSKNTWYHRAYKQLEHFNLTKAVKAQIAQKR